MKNKFHIRNGLLFLVMTAFAFQMPTHAQQSFFNQYAGPQPVQGGIFCNAGVTANAYYFTCMNYLLETDQGGNVRWGREFRHNNNIAYLYALEERATGGFYGGANAYDVTQMLQHYIVFRLDSAGNTIWTKEVQLNITNANLMRVATAADGGLGICASTAVINGQAGTWVGKTDSLGNLLWGKIIRHGPLTTTSGCAIAPTRDGGFIVTSKVYISNSSSLQHTGLSRLDANGNLLWTRTFSASGANDWPFATQCADGGFAIAGCGTSTGTDGFRLCKTDSAGNLLWSTCYFDLPSMCYAQKVQETADRGFIISGIVLDMNTLVQYPLMVRTDSVGDTRWARKLVFSNYCGATSWDVQETPDGGFLMPAADLSLIKTDPNGDISCVSFPVTITEVDSLVSQTSSIDFLNGGAVTPTILGNTLLPFSDTTHCAGEFSPAAITVHDAAAELMVFPNPSEGIFNLQFENGNASYDVAVYNTIGQLVRSYNSNSQQLVIDLTAADAGVYFVRINTETGQRSGTVKLLKK
jgi:hypothetical protein